MSGAVTIIWLTCNAFISIFVSYIVRQTIAYMDRTAVHRIHIDARFGALHVQILQRKYRPTAHTHKAFSGQDLRRSHLFQHDVHTVHFVQLQHITSQYMIEQPGETMYRYKQHWGLMLKKRMPKQSQMWNTNRGSFAKWLLEKLLEYRKIMKHLPCCLNRKDPTPQDRNICYLLPNCEINLWTYAANMCKKDVDFCCQN